MITFFNFLVKNKKVKTTNYFDYPTKVKKTLLLEAVRKANEMQLALVRNNRVKAS